MTTNGWMKAVVAGGALVVLGACSSFVGGLLTDAGQLLEDGGNAHAQVPSLCKKWVVQRMYFDSIGATPNLSTSTSLLAGGEITIPEGWEPFGSTAYGSASSSSQFLVLRKCVL